MTYQLLAGPAHSREFAKFHHELCKAAGGEDAVLERQGIRDIVKDDPTEGERARRAALLLEDLAEADRKWLVERESELGGSETRDRRLANARRRRMEARLEAIEALVG